MHVPSSVCLHSVQYFYHVSFSCMSSFAIHWLPAHFFSVCVVVELFDSSSFCWFAVITTFVVHIVQPLNTIDSRILKDFIRCNCSRYYLVHTQEFFITFDDAAATAGFFSSSVHRQTSSLLWLISCILNILTKVIEKSM